MINLISDTVTKPTPKMLKAMFAAQVGDDVFDADPTVTALQHKVANIFGMEAALFCASGTMTNQIAIKVHTRPGDEVICHQYAHIFHYEGGGTMANSGVSARLVGETESLLTAAQVSAAICKPGDMHAARTALIEVENTSNKSGGSCYDLQTLQEIGEVAKAHKLAYHLDGARLFNALAVTGDNLLDYGNTFDSITICLSKGLGCPIGSVLVGNKDFIAEAKRVRKRFGGAWRQAGYLAAAGIYALDNHVARLAEDHEKAKILETCLLGLDYVAKVDAVYTNIVIFTLKDQTKSDFFIEALKQNNILLIGMGQGRLRLVTHLDVSMADIKTVCQVLQKLKF